MTNFERTPDGALYDLPENWSCTCGCGEIVEKENFVRMNGQEFYIPGHETRRDEREKEENVKRAESDFTPDW